MSHNHLLQRSVVLSGSSGVRSVRTGFHETPPQSSAEDSGDTTYSLAKPRVGYLVSKEATEGEAKA